jgi:hypothetical protein
LLFNSSSIFNSTELSISFIPPSNIRIANGFASFEKAYIGDLIPGNLIEREDCDLQIRPPLTSPSKSTPTRNLLSQKGKTHVFLLANSSISSLRDYLDHSLSGTLDTTWRAKDKVEKDGLHYITLTVP